MSKNVPIVIISGAESDYAVKKAVRLRTVQPSRASLGAF